MPVPVASLRGRLVAERYVLRKRTGRFLLPLRLKRSSNARTSTKPIWRIKKVRRVFAWKLRSSQSKDNAVDENNAMIDHMQGVIDKLLAGVDGEIGDIDRALEATEVDDRYEPDHLPLVLPLAPTDAEAAAENLEHFFALADEIPFSEMPDFSFDYQLPHRDSYVVRNEEESESESGSVSSVERDVAERDDMYTPLQPNKVNLTTVQPRCLSAELGQWSEGSERGPLMAAPSQPPSDPEHPELDLSEDEKVPIMSTEPSYAMEPILDEQEEEKPSPQLRQISTEMALPIESDPPLIHEDSGFMAPLYSTPTAEKTPRKSSNEKVAFLIHEDNGLPPSPLVNSSPVSAQIGLTKQKALGGRGAPLMQAKSSHSSNIMHMLKEDSGLSFSPTSSPGSPGLQLGKLPTFQGISAPRHTFQTRLDQLNATKKSVATFALNSRDQESAQKVSQEGKVDPFLSISLGSQMNLEPTITSVPPRATHSRLEDLHSTKKNSPLGRHVINHDDQ